MLRLSAAPVQIDKQNLILGVSAGLESILASGSVTVLYAKLIPSTSACVAKAASVAPNSRKNLNIPQFAAAEIFPRR